MPSNSTPEIMKVDHEGHLWITPPSSSAPIEYSSEDIKCLCDMVDQHKAEHKAGMLFDLRGLDVTLTVSASRYLATRCQEHNNYFAQGFLVDSLSSRLSVNFFIRVHAPECASKLFMNPVEAIEWLNAQCTSSQNL